MKIFKKYFALAITAILIIGVANGCSPDNNQPTSNQPASSEQSQNAKPTSKPEEPKKPVNKPTISKAEFEKIENGMTYDQVKEIIGSGGELMSETGEKGSEFYTVMYSWKGEGDLGSNANAIFQGGKLSSKAQFGLK